MAATSTAVPVSYFPTYFSNYVRSYFHFQCVGPFSATLHGGPRVCSLLRYTHARTYTAGHSWPFGPFVGGNFLETPSDPFPRCMYKLTIFLGRDWRPPFPKGCIQRLFNRVTRYNDDRNEFLPLLYILYIQQIQSIAGVQCSKDQRVQFKE